MKSVLIHAANLHVGGGVQVAASFLAELPRLLQAHPQPTVRMTILASTEVDRNLRSTGVDPASLPGYRVLDVQGLATLRPGAQGPFTGHDVVFTVFGPLYLWRSPARHACGFAQPWILMPDNAAARRLPWPARLKARLKYAIQWRFFRRADRLVVELDHVRDTLARDRHFPAGRIEVIPNTVAPVFYNPAAWEPIPALRAGADGVVRLGCIARDYPHKNLALLTALAAELRRQGQRDYRLHVTLTDDEWQARDAAFHEAVVNVGALRIAQCPPFYEAMDGIVFPSLLECFSATPLEALGSGRRLFASDRGYVRDVCGPHASYFNPLDPADAAARIVDWYERSPEASRRAELDAGQAHALAWPDNRARAEAYLRIALDLLN